MTTNPPHVQKASGMKTMVRERLRRLGLVCLGGLAILYMAGVTAGYLWLRYGRKIEQVRIVDVALCRVGAVRQAIGRQHYAHARIEAEAKNYQAAYIAYVSGIRQDPGNVSGRLDAAAFFRSVGATNQGLAVLEEGLERHPEEARIIEATFGQLKTNGRAGYALELLRRRYAKGFPESSARMLQTFEIEATLAAKGAGAARKLLDQHPELSNYPPATPVAARILWESQEKSRAIELMGRHLGTKDAVYEDHALLATWQSSAGLPEEASRTAQRACGIFPKSAAARVLLIEMRAAGSPTKGPSFAEIAAYLKDFKSSPEALLTLSSTAGRRGWLSLTRLIYEVGTVTQSDLGLLALNHADALARNSRFQEYRDLLAEVDAQAGENGSAAFMMQLRSRQVIAAGALRDLDNVREYSRRLATLARNDPDRLEAFRQFFKKVDLEDAVAELTPRVANTKVAVSK